MEILKWEDLFCFHSSKHILSCSYCHCSQELPAWCIIPCSWTESGHIFPSRAFQSLPLENTAQIVCPRERKQSQILQHSSQKKKKNQYTNSNYYYNRDLFWPWFEMEHKLYVTFLSFPNHAFSMLLQNNIFLKKIKTYYSSSWFYIYF